MKRVNVEKGKRRYKEDKVEILRGEREKGRRKPERGGKGNEIQAKPRRWEQGKTEDTGKGRRKI